MVGHSFLVQEKHHHYIHISLSYLHMYMNDNYNDDCTLLIMQDYMKRFEAFQIADFCCIGGGNVVHSLLLL